jgi:hypothetical protein
MMRVALAALLLSATVVAAGEPNVLAEVNRDFVNAIAGQTTVKPECVYEREKRVVVTGSGMSSTRVTVEFAPNTDYAQTYLCLDGTMQAQMVARQGKVAVCTDGEVHFQGKKCICIDGNDLHWGCASVNACPHLEFRGVSTQFCLIDPAVRRLATRVYYRKEDESHEKFAYKTERRVTEQFDRESEVELVKQSKAYRENLLGGLDKNKIRPQELRFATTVDLLMVRGRLEGAAPGDWAPTPLVHGRPDISVRVHQSLLNNAAATIFAGKTKSGGDLETDVNNLLGPLGKKVELDPEDREAFTVTFAPGLPIETTFAGGKIKFTIRTNGFVSGDRVVSDPFLIEALYDFRRIGAGLELERKADVDVAPPDVAAGTREPSAREQTLSVLLRKRFNKLLPQKITIEKIELAGNMKKIGNLQPTQADSDNGWLTLGLDRAKKP